MDRRSFLGLGAGLGLSLGGGLVPLLASSRALAAQAPTESSSHTSQSSFFPNVPLVDQNGKSVLFYDDMIKNKTVLLNFFLIGCQDGRCPIATANLRKVQDMLGDRMGKDVFFISVTLQPELESPKILKKYADSFEVKPGWSFLTGKPQDIDMLRRSLGYSDPDPERDRDLTNHIGMARYGNDKFNRWGAISLRSSPANIASTFQWLGI